MYASPASTYTVGTQRGLRDKRRHNNIEQLVAAL